MTGLERLKKPLGDLRFLYWGERVVLTLCGACVIYFLLGKLFATSGLGVLLWNKFVGATAGFITGLLFALMNLFHLRLYGPSRANFATVTEEIDRSYAAQGFKPIPGEVKEVVAAYERCLEPIFFSGPVGYVISIILGAVICLGSVAVLKTFPG